jgi:hypothetical protein
VFSTDGTALWVGKKLQDLLVDHLGCGIFSPFLYDFSSQDAVGMILLIFINALRALCHD